MDTIQATILNAKLKKYRNDIKKRNDIAIKYNEILYKDFNLPFIEKFNNSVWAQYTIKIKNRENIILKLNSVGIPTNIYYPQPLHLQNVSNILIIR